MLKIIRLSNKSASNKNDNNRLVFKKNNDNNEDKFNSNNIEKSKN